MPLIAQAIVFGISSCDGDPSVKLCLAIKTVPKPAYSVSSSDSSPINTPTRTITSDSVKDIMVASAPLGLPPCTINGDISSVPEPGGEYMIRELDSGRAITLVDGRLTLVLDAGFRNTVSRKYFGRDNKGGFCAEAGRLHAWESFLLRPREAGGYNLWVKHWFMLKAMAILEHDGTLPRLVEARNTQEAALWEFVKTLAHKADFERLLYMLAIKAGPLVRGNIRRIPTRVEGAQKDGFAEDLTHPYGSPDPSRIDGLLYMGCVVQNYHGVRVTFSYDPAWRELGTIRNYATHHQSLAAQRQGDVEEVIDSASPEQHKHNSKLSEQPASVTMSPQKLPLHQLGRDGPQVPQLGFGLMELSISYENTTLSDAERFKVLDRAWEIGATFWDTAAGYGDSEALIGKWLKLHPERRQDVFIATKFGFGAKVGGDGKVSFTIDSSPENCRRSCEKSLLNLGVDSIDLFYVHRFDRITPVEKTMEALVDLKSVDIETEVGTNLQATCRKVGVAIVPYSPLGRGFLSGKFRSLDDLDAMDKRRALPRFSLENFPKNIELANTLRDMAAAKNCMPAQLTLAWIMAQGQDMFPIPGTKNLKYLEQNVGSFDVEMTPEDNKHIREMIKLMGGASGARQVAHINSSDLFYRQFYQEIIRFLDLKAPTIYLH
ncbi:hypothetical protein CHU98_g2844 [Xylaria longipes]|nr:hypothetical protein CHU98_g2844 [Xylaria longipes]